MGPGHWISANTRVRIVRVLVRLRLFHEAEAVLEVAHAVLFEHFGDENPDVRAARALFRRLYTEWGKPEKARAFEQAPVSSRKGKRR